MRVSHGRQVLVRALCKAYTQLGIMRETERWCEELLKMQGCENDAEGLVGRAEGLAKKEEWEEAARVLEKAFEESGRQRRDVGWFLSC
jgi:DnaJ family protein C protein 3